MLDRFAYDILSKNEKIYDFESSILRIMYYKSKIQIQVWFQKIKKFKLLKVWEV